MDRWIDRLLRPSKSNFFNSQACSAIASASCGCCFDSRYLAKSNISSGVFSLSDTPDRGFFQSNISFGAARIDIAILSIWFRNSIEEDGGLLVLLVSLF